MIPNLYKQEFINNKIIMNSDNSNELRMNTIPITKVRFPPKLSLFMGLGSNNAEKYLFQKIIQLKEIPMKFLRIFSL